MFSYDGKRIILYSKTEINSGVFWGSEKDDAVEIKGVIILTTSRCFRGVIPQSEFESLNKFSSGSPRGIKAPAER